MILKLLFDAILFVLSAIPLYLAVKFLGGRTSLLKTALVSFIAGLVFSTIKGVLGIVGAVVAFIVMIWIYREMFQLQWIKALLAWMLQFLILLLIYVVVFFMAAALGVALMIF